jgi:hypothetical protein
MWKLGWVAAGLLGLVGCFGNNAETDQNEDDEQRSTFRSVDLGCDNDGFTLTADVSGSVDSVQVTVWLVDDELGTYELSNRGDGNWTVFVSDDDMGATCLGDSGRMYFLFEGIGGTSDFEESLERGN